MVLPPVFQIARLNWVRYRAARKTLKHLADAASRRAFMRHARRSMSLTRLAKPTDNTAPLVPLRVKALHGQTIYCRSGLADLGVVYDTFEGRYHLPPAGIGAVRTILDLGANIGLTMAHFAVLYPGARILGVELDAANCELCRKNIAPYGERCQVLNAAVWHTPGEVSYAGVRESGYAIATGLEQRAKATAPAITVDALIERLGAAEVDFVKMDIEGAEKEVLGHADAWIGRVRSIKVEVHPEKASTLYTLGMCIEDLERHGMACSVDARHHACVIGRRW